jgi:hypothetical protein
MGGLTIAAGITLLIFGERIGLTGKLIPAICRRDNADYPATGM